MIGTAGDPEGDSDDDLQVPTAYEDISQTVYVKACSLFGVVPSTVFLRHLPTTVINLYSHAIGDLGAKAVATALVTNKSVKRLNVSRTDLGTAGLGFIMEMLEANSTLTELLTIPAAWVPVPVILHDTQYNRDTNPDKIQDLSSNSLQSPGAEILSDAFIKNQTVRALIISDNGFKDDDSQALSEIIEENVFLRSLVVSRNSFGEKAGIVFGRALENNSSLLEFDISWNHLRQAGAIEFCCSLQNNSSLLGLNLSWNGLGMEGCHELGKALQVNRTLTDLDVSANRINYDAFKLILRGLVKNNSIRSLKIGCNPITTDGATAILRAIADDRCSNLTRLDLSDVSVDSDFVDFLRKLQKLRPLVVKHGITLRHDDLRKGDVPVVLDTDDPVTILFEFVKTKNLRLIDFLKNLDKDNSETLSRDELRRGLEEIDLPLSQRSMDILMSKLDLNEDGVIDYSELALKHKEHLRRVAKLRKEADIDLKHYKSYDRMQQLRETVRLRLAFSNHSD